MKPIYAYPESLREAANTGSQPFMSFGLKQRGNPEVGEMIFMYLPTSIAVSDGASFSGVDLGANRALKSLKAGSTNENDVAAKAIELAGNVGGTLESAAVEFGMNQGVALNPFTNLAFEGMTPRTWQFEFKLISESAEEAKTIKFIENWLRKNMYAEKIGDFSLKYPPMLRTQFWDGEAESQFLPMIMDSFVTGLSVQYNESNSMYHDDGAPVETSISLSLSENKTLTKHDLYLQGSLEYNRKGRDDSTSDATDTGTEVNNALDENNAAQAEEKKKAAAANTPTIGPNGPA
jgi:hypothetical protein